MFGLGMPEILLILAIALIVIGPKKLPDLAKTLGRAMGEFKRSAQDFKRSIDVETTVKDIKDIDIPKTDLTEILKDTDTKDETIAEAQDEMTAAVKEDSGSQDNDKKTPDNNEDETSDDKNSDETDNNSEHNKNN